MKPLPHVYTTQLSAGPDGYGTVSAASLQDLRVAPPRDFDGPGDAWSPEQLLLAAVESCFLFTLQAVARASRLDFISVHLSCEGTVDRKDGTTLFTEIILRPRLAVPAGGDRAKALKVLEKSEKACLVSASLSTPIRLESEVVQGS